MSERTKALEAIFHEAMDLASAEERGRYLSQACADDPELRREVEGLLQSAAEADSVFQAGREACHVPGETPTAVLTEVPGDKIGRYKLLEQIGEGGMGVVYMAEQEKPVRRKVALKIIKLGMDTRQVVARFEAERQALAMMDHPHIARVLDGGATETGRPYFVMELVQGVPITEFCEANRLSLEERLKLFMVVCQAIQSAHQKGVIHRDIKPSNVLVTLHNGTPHPMVIDFGVAKATNQKLTEKTLFTNFATMIGTPAYMSPEQAEMSKLDVDTRSDIYSLGVLLYELLTGTTPFPEERLRSVAYSEMQRIIAEEEPEHPSTRLKKKPAAFKSEIRNSNSEIDVDLDWIVMKCLEKNRNRRYETANGLASDLQRYLSNEPVVARPPSAAYRLRKFARRNKVWFAAATVALVAVFGGLLASTWHAVRATRAERDALAVKDFLIEQLLAANLEMETEGDPNRRQLLKRVAEAAGSTFADQPLIEAEVRTAVGEAFLGLDDAATALEEFKKGVAVRRRLLGPMHSDTLWTLACAALAHQQMGQWNESENLLAEPLARVKAQGGPRTLGEAEVLMMHLVFLSKMGHAAEALSYHEQMLKVAERFSDHKSWRFQNKLQWQVSLNIEAGRLKEADALSLAGIRQAEAHFGTNHPIAANFYHSRAYFLNRSGRHLEAASFHEKIVPIRWRSIGTNHRHTLRSEYNLARTLEAAGEFERALNGYSNLYERVAARLPMDWAREELCVMGMFFKNQKRFDLAQAALGPLCKSYETDPPANAKDFEMFLHTAAMSKGWPAAASLCRQYLDLFANSHEMCRDAARWLVQEGRADDAKALYDCLRESFSAKASLRPEDMEMLIETTAATSGWPAAADLYRKEFESFPDSPLLWLNKAWVFRYVGDADSYHRVVARALAAPSSIITTNDQHVPIEIAALGSLPFSDKQIEQLDAMMNALEVALPGCSTNQQTWGYRAMGQMQLRLGRFDQCLAALEKSALHQTSSDPYTLFIRAICLHRMGRLAEAQAAFKQAETSMDSRLLSESFGEIEGFLPAWQLFQQVLMRREAQALLGMN